MGQDLCQAYPAAADLFAQAEQITGLALRKFCFEGPDEQLARTDIAQPAIFTVSAAMLASLHASSNNTPLLPACAAGLSLGEYTALYIAGAMDFATGVRLVTRRGELMQQAAEAVPSGMISVMGLEEAQAVALCQAAAQGEILTCANFNCPGQIVLSGQREACQRVLDLAEKFGARGAVALNVAGAFHSPIMVPAAEGLAEALQQVEFTTPETNVLANVDATVHGTSEQIKQKLIQQLTCPIRWQRCMEALLAENIDAFYEIGPGRVLAGLMRRVDRKTKVTCLNDRQSLEKFTGS